MVSFRRISRSADDKCAAAKLSRVSEQNVHVGDRPEGHDKHRIYRHSCSVFAHQRHVGRAGARQYSQRKFVGRIDHAITWHFCVSLSTACHYSCRLADVLNATCREDVVNTRTVGIVGAAFSDISQAINQIASVFGQPQVSMFHTRACKTMSDRGVARTCLLRHR